MYKRFITIFAIITLNFIPLSAIECTQKVYAPALKKIPTTLDLLAQSAVDIQTLQALRQVKISKQNYEKDMKILQEKIKLLQRKKDFAMQAKTLNDENLQTWNALTQSCKGDNLIAAKKVTKDLSEIKQLINKRLSTIEHYMRLTQIGIKVGKRKYAPQKENTTQKSQTSN